MNDTLAVDGLVVAFRSAEPSDEGVIFSAWLEAHRKHGDWPKRLSSRRYFEEHKLTVAKLIARSKTLVACNESRTGQVFGFICYETPAILHWLYTKQVYRRLGIARAMIARAFQPGTEGIACSHWTARAGELVERGSPWYYDPFIVEGT